MAFSFSQLEHPIVLAPLGGGPSTAALAAAVSEAGGLGFLAAGYRTPGAVRAELGELRELTARPFGLNLFAPGPPSGDVEALDGQGAPAEAAQDRHQLLTEP